MKLLEKILIPVKLEDTEQGHLTFAVKLAEKFSSKIILLCVLPNEAKLENVKGMVDSYAQSELKKMIVNMNYQEEKVETMIEYGSAFEKIISVSENENVNLIVNNSVTNKSTEGNVDLLSEKLVRKSAKPVLIYKNNGSNLFTNLLCPVDVSEASERALNNAIKVARIFNSKLHVINVYTPLEECFPTRLKIDLDYENKKQKKINKEIFEKFVDKFNFTDLDVSFHELNGNPDEVIVHFARKNHIDIIFIGATGKTYIQRMMLGSTTEKVLKAFPSSMLVTKAENLLDLKIESNISTIEKHLNQAIRLEKLGYFEEAIEQLKICLHINDLHLPVLNRLREIYLKVGDKESSENYKKKIEEVLRRLWDKQIELEIRKGLKL